jgi:hypothetical protein
LAAPSPQLELRPVLLGSDTDHRPHVTARPHSVCQQCHDTGNRLRTDTASEPNKRVVDSRTVLKIPPDAVDLRREHPDVAPAHPVDGLYNRHPRLVEAREPLEKLRCGLLDARDVTLVEVPNNRVGQYHD